jgi:hypothetical protein
LGTTNPLRISVAAAARLAARDGVDFVNWQEGQHIEADFSLQGDWVDASIIEVNVDEDVVVIDFGDPLDQCWANDEISNVKAFSLLQVAAGGRLHRHFRPRYAGNPADILAALQVSAPGEAGTMDSDDDGSDECASPNEESKDEELPKVRCEACKEDRMRVQHRETPSIEYARALSARARAF